HARARASATFAIPKSSPQQPQLSLLSPPHRTPHTSHHTRAFPPPPTHHIIHAPLKKEMSSYQTTTATGGAQDPSTMVVDTTARTVHYKCGDCDQDVPLKRGEPIRCRNCGHRVLYKQRTNRSKLADITMPFLSLRMVKEASEA
ncbi:hypothetical protein J1614_009419, partial [Plenodomus biglobosus]